jgi:hypothetical protein
MKTALEASLLPCPFCASKEIRILPQKDGWIFVRCAWCSGQVSVVTMFEEQAAEHWNARGGAKPDSLEAMLSECFDGNLRERIYEAFGYEEQWRTFPFSDKRDCFWLRTPHKFAYSPEPFTKEGIVSGEHLYSGVVYTQRHLSQWVYEAEGFVMALLDTRCDGNIFLMVFRAERECKDAALVGLYREYWG